MYPTNRQPPKTSLFLLLPHACGNLFLISFFYLFIYYFFNLFPQAFQNQKFKTLRFFSHLV